MTFLSAAHIPLFLMEGYILTFAALNVLALLISLFYRKKVQTGAPRAVFLIAILATLFAGTMIFTSGNNSNTLNSMAFIILGCGGIASAIGTLNLFFIMRKVRK